MAVIDLFTGFGVNLVVALLIVRGIYYPAGRIRTMSSPSWRSTPSSTLS